MLFGGALSKIDGRQRVRTDLDCRTDRQTENVLLIAEAGQKIRIMAKLTKLALALLLVISHSVHGAKNHDPKSDKAKDPFTKSKDKAEPRTHPVKTICVIPSMLDDIRDGMTHMYSNDEGKCEKTDRIPLNPQFYGHSLVSSWFVFHPVDSRLQWMLSPTADDKPP